MKSLLYGVNTNNQVIVIGDRVNFGNVVRRYGKNIDMTGGEVFINGEGYYNIDASVTFAGTGAGDVTVTLLRDGAIIPGAGATATLAAAGTITLTLPPCVVRQKCCGESTITAVITGLAGAVTNATIRIEKT